MKSWAYKILTIGNSESAASIQRELEELGSQGWELVSTLRLTKFNYWGGADIRYFFKREK